MGTVDIGEVALAAGYDTHTAFSKAFKQHFDLAPTKRSATSAVRQLLHKFGHNFNTTLPKLAKQNKCSIIL